MWSWHHERLYASHVRITRIPNHGYNNYQCYWDLLNFESFMARKTNIHQGRFCSNLWKARFFKRFPFLGFEHFPTRWWFRMIFFVFWLSFFRYVYKLPDFCHLKSLKSPKSVAESRGGTRAVHKASSGLNFQLRNPSECGPPSPPLTNKKRRKRMKKLLLSDKKVRICSGKAWFGSIYIYIPH